MSVRFPAISRLALAVAGAIAALGLSLAAQQPQRQGGPAPAPQVRGGYTEAATLPARIMEFKATPETVKAGDTVTLSWAVENPRTTEIQPTIGRATPRGLMKVTPKATTTYTLTVTGVNGTLTRTVTVTVPGTTPVAAAASAASSSAAPTPRTADGKPDLSGVYGYGVAPGGRGAAPPAAPGELPRTPTLKPGAEKYRVVRGPEDTGLYSDCRPPGVPQTFMVPYYIQIVQAPKQVVILHEYLMLSRIILLDAQHLPDPDPFYMGHSVGKWEGDTLVVDSVGFKESEFNGYKTTEALHVVERFGRPNLNTLTYQAVLEDPNVFAGPWQVTRTFPFLPEHQRVDEFICENNRDYKPLFGK